MAEDRRSTQNLQSGNELRPSHSLRTSGFDRSRSSPDSDDSMLDLSETGKHEEETLLGQVQDPGIVRTPSAVVSERSRKGTSSTTKPHQSVSSSASSTLSRFVDSPNGTVVDYSQSDTPVARGPSLLCGLTGENQSPSRKNNVPTSISLPLTTTTTTPPAPLTTTTTTPPA
ncbi:mucin-2, partial [Aplysia californica]|uniref:Mucin-2 n=1 Tax=Aplysia californica TaxID=6500 RepID=A0ABM1ACZ6_APLCA